jgi:hypothetical protein
MPAARVARAPKVAARPATGPAATGRPEIARPVIDREQSAQVATARLPTGRRVIGHVAIDPLVIAQRAMPQHHEVTGPPRRKVIARRARQVIAPMVIDRHAPMVAPGVMARRVVSVVSARPEARKVASAATGVVVCKARGPSPWVRVREVRVVTAMVALAASRVVMVRQTAPRQQPRRRRSTSQQPHRRPTLRQRPRPAAPIKADLLRRHSAASLAGERLATSDACWPE